MNWKLVLRHKTRIPRMEFMPTALINQNNKRFYFAFRFPKILVAVSRNIR